MIEAKDLVAGATFKFLKYAEPPKDGVELKSNTEVLYISHVEDGEGFDITVEAPNPNFDPKARVSAKNPERVQVHLYEDELEVVKAAAKATRAAKTPAKRGAEPAATAPAAKRTATKATTKRTAEATAKADTAKAEPKAKTKPEAKVKAKAEPKVKQESEEPEVYVPDVIALKTEDEEILALVGEAETVDRLVDIAISELENSSNAEYRLGGIIHHLRLSGAFVNYGGEGKYSKANGGFKAFAERELEISSRKALYFSTMYYQFNKLGIAGNKVTEIGWTKAMKIAEAASAGDNDSNEKCLPISKAEANKLIALAKKSTVDELDAHIKTQYRKASDTPTEVFKKITISLPESRASIILNHLETAKEMFETDSTHDAFARIVEEWADQNVGQDA